MEVRSGAVAHVRYDHYNGHMVIRMTATQVKEHVLSLLDQVADGEEVEITKHGRTVARLIPAHNPHGLRGSFEGIAMTAADEADLFTTGAKWDLQSS